MAIRRVRIKIFTIACLVVPCSMFLALSGAVDYAGAGSSAWGPLGSTGSGGETEAATTTTFYFAEGYTGDGFQEYLCLGNPDEGEASAEITYLYKDGSTAQGDVTIPSASRTTLNVNAEAGADREVSIMVTSQQGIVAERPMYFNYQGRWTGGHDTVGATTPSFLWYFAEGYTGAGFEEWICVLNPNDAAAELTFYFQTQEEGLKIEGGHSVQAHSRASFRVNDLLEGKSYQTSLTLTSSQLIVAERPMYFDYTGKGSWHWQGGHCVMGATGLSREYFFAEGTTRGGFEAWITVQNPSPLDISVNATYQLGEGQGGPVQATYELPASTRRTIFIQDEVGKDKDVSVYLSSTNSFLAERPMYFSYGGSGGNNWQGGHCVIGATAASQDWFFAEGYTGAGFEQWICIQNPSAEPATVTVSYYTQDSGELAGTLSPVTIQPNTRLTIYVNSDAGPDLQLSTFAESSVDVVVERPMYFNFNGWDGGHDVVGYAH